MSTDIVAPKSFGAFRTHTRFTTTAKPEFMGFTELSPSGSVQRWLATAEDASIHLTTDAAPQTIPVTAGSIVLCEADTGGWVVAVPVARAAFEGEHAVDLPEPVSHGRRVTTDRSTIA